MTDTASAATDPGAARSDREIVIYPNSDVLAAATAARLITALSDIQATGRVPAIALTGGGVGTATLRQVAASPARAAVDWRNVDFYWGDERFVPEDSDDRNAKGAREALLAVVDADPERIYEMAPSDGEFGADIDAAARGYTEQLPEKFDIVMLGMGPEGHMASLFPDTDAVRDTSTGAIAVRDSPKPPPERISLTLPAIRTADEVWFIVGGPDKAPAVAQAVAGGDPVALPARGATGSRVTRWLLDADAASDINAG